MISPGGFAFAIGILIVAWIFVPNNARPLLALLLILSVLGMRKEPAEVIRRFFGGLK